MRFSWQGDLLFAGETQQRLDQRDKIAKHRDEECEDKKSQGSTLFLNVPHDLLRKRFFKNLFRLAGTIRGELIAEFGPRAG